MKKQGYHVSENHGGIVAVYVTGYVVEKEIAGKQVRFGVRKCDGVWTVDSVDTGLGAGPGHKFRTRKEALEYVNGKDAQTGRGLEDAMASYIEKHGFRFEAEKAAHEISVYRKEPWPVIERARWVERRTAELVDKAGLLENGFKRAEPSPEPEIECKDLELRGEHVCITGTLAGMTRGEAFIRLKAVGGIPSERFSSKTTVLVIAADSGKGKREKADKAIAKGQDVKVVSGTAFMEALKRAEADMKRAVDERAKLAPPPAKKPERPAAPKPPAKPKKEEGVDKRVEELEKKLAAAEAKAKMWEQKAEEYYSAKEQPEQAPDKAPENALSMDSLKEWCDERGLTLNQKREGCPVWIHGNSRAYRDELVEKGFRWGCSKTWGKGWHIAAEKVA